MTSRWFALTATYKATLTDFKRKGRCNVSNTCSNRGCPGWEDATRITNIAAYVPGTPTADICVAQSATTYVCQNPAISCDDGDACTVDLCDVVTGCAQTPVVCPSGESCSGGVCIPIPKCGGRNASCTSNSSR